MILEDEREMDLEFFYDNVGSRVKPARDPNRIRAFLQTYKEIENADTHFQLQEDLIEHHWQRAGQWLIFVFICICIHDKFCIALFKFATVIWIIICNVDDYCIMFDLNNLVLLSIVVLCWIWYLRANEMRDAEAQRADPA